MNFTDPAHVEAVQCFDVLDDWISQHMMGQLAAQIAPRSDMTKLDPRELLSVIFLHQYPSEIVKARDELLARYVSEKSDWIVKIRARLDDEARQMKLEGTDE